MVFNSLTFVVFFACVLALHALPLPWTAKKINLLIASYLFYAAWNPPFVILLWVSTVIDWYAAQGLVKARRPAIQPAEAVPARANVHDRLNLSVYQEFVSENSVQVEQIEEKYSIVIETSVRKQHVHIKIRDARCWVGDAGKTEPSRLITGVKVIVEVVHSRKSLVDVLCCEVYAVIVVPQCAHRFVDVAVRRMSRSEAC